ncbi:hypothetical protein PHMEG_00034352 [Phytophthora megakarya]|uniref:DDE-1 domain-containing protein n=1 Tax=Phytophthora megakarya TaxID=4795 RepID=A0A225URL5_9STRA|nr:hypothetical protein PHMEG_00034352 [Phytophthora megakarya]
MTRVVVLRGSKNVWHTDPKMNFHLSFVACGNNIVMKECDIYGATVTTTNKAFMTASLFAKWLVFFSNAVPTPIKRPLLLLMDGCSSHLSTTIVNIADHQQIRMVCLPANGKHLLQPLGVEVFSSFKSKLKLFIDELIRENGETTIVIAK